MGVNEELFSRVVILSRLEQAFRAAWAVTITAVLFGLQHLSALALTDRGLEDVAFNVLLSGVYGFALAAYQVRFRWVWPLILIHALADFTTILAVEELPEWLIAVNHVGLLVFGLAVLRWVAPRALPRPAPA